MALYKTATHITEFTFTDEWSGDPMIELGEYNGEWYFEIPSTFPIPTHPDVPLVPVVLTQDILTGLLKNTSGSNVDPTFIFLSKLTIAA